MTCCDDLRRPFGAAELLGVRLDHGLRLPGDAVGSSWYGRNTTSTSISSPSCASARLEAALADVAPRAHDVGPDLDSDGRGAGDRSRSTVRPYRGRHGRIVGSMSDRGRQRATPRSAPRSSTSGSRCGVRHAVVAPGSRQHADGARARRARRTRGPRGARRARRRRSWRSGSASTACRPCCCAPAAPRRPTSTRQWSRPGLSDVPMLVLTADRPPELRGVGAPQTIDQIELYGRVGPLVPRRRRARRCRPATLAAARTDGCSRTASTRPGAPQPAVPRAAAGRDRASCPSRSGRRCRSPRGSRTSGPVPPELRPSPRGVIVAGGRHGEDRRRDRGARRTRWRGRCSPTRRSGCRTCRRRSPRSTRCCATPTFARDHAPQRGGAHRSPAGVEGAAQWILATGAPVLQVGGPGVIDPDHNVDALLLARRPRSAHRVPPARRGSARWQSRRRSGRGRDRPPRSATARR